MIYDPASVVHHFIEQRRLSKDYFRKWKRDNAYLTGQTGPTSRSMSVLGIPLYMLRQLFESVVRWSGTSLFHQGNPFRHELQIISILSFMRGRLSARFFRGRSLQVI